MKGQNLYWKSGTKILKYPIWGDFMNTSSRFKQLKNIIGFESETEKEIRSNIEERIQKSSTRVFEHSAAASDRR